MSATPQHPNILFFFTDQQRWDTCGCYGQRQEVTPTLDGLAADGVRFEHAFSCQPVCGPARACLQTGRYATEIGCHTNHRILPENETTLAKELSAAGYETGYIGKWHLASGGPLDGPDNFRTSAIPPHRRGGYRDYWLAADALEHTSHGWDGGHMFDADGNKVSWDGYRVDAQTEFVLDFLRTRKQEKPWFLFLSYLEPHHQNDRNHYEGPPGSKERFGDYDVPGDLEGTEGDWRKNYPDYLGCCRSLDDNLARILGELERLGMRDNTLIIFTSDHGSHFRTRNGEYKRSCHDGSIRVPLVIHGPGFKGGMVRNEMTSLIDLPPTVLAAAGITPPPVMGGRPLQQLIDETTDSWPEEAFVQISESQVGRAIRTKKWTYSVRAPHKSAWNDPGSDIYIEDFLYDNERDPYQRTNLVADPTRAEVRRSLAERLIRRMLYAGESAPEILPNDRMADFEKKAPPSANLIPGS